MRARDPAPGPAAAGHGHCRHCLGDCGGECLLPGSVTLCIHRPLPRRPARQWLVMLRTPAFWRRVFWGIR